MFSKWLSHAASGEATSASQPQILDQGDCDVSTSLDKYGLLTGMTLAGFDVNMIRF